MRRIGPFDVHARATDPLECWARSPRRPTPTRSACWPRRNCSGCASMNRAHCARVNTPQWRRTRTIHPARRPVQPSGSSALSRPRGRTIAPLAADFNSCSSTSMPGTLRSRPQGNQPLGNVPMSQEVSGRFRTYQGHRTPPPAGRPNDPVSSEALTRLGVSTDVGNTETSRRTKDVQSPPGGAVANKPKSRTRGDTSPEALRTPPRGRWPRRVRLVR